MVRVKNLDNAVGAGISLVFQITQHTRDTILIKHLIDYFGCGKYRERKGGLAGDFLVYKLSDISEKILPFFDRYPILGVKSQEYCDFKQVTEFMIKKEHLTLEGVEKIKKIQSKMNTKR